MVIDAGQDKFFSQLCEAMGLPELAHDPHFEHCPERLANRDGLMAIRQQPFSPKPPMNGWRSRWRIRSGRGR